MDRIETLRSRYSDIQLAGRRVNGGWWGLEPVDEDEQYIYCGSLGSFVGARVVDVTWHPFGARRYNLVVFDSFARNFHSLEGARRTSIAAGPCDVALTLDDQRIRRIH